MRCRWWLVAAFFPFVAQASPMLRCHFEVNAEHFEHSFQPVSDPYTVTSVNLADRFRFKAVVLGDDTRVDLINLYVFYQTQRQPMILQHAVCSSTHSSRARSPCADWACGFVFAVFRQRVDLRLCFA